MGWPRVELLGCLLRLQPEGLIKGQTPIQRAWVRANTAFAAKSRETWLLLVENQNLSGKGPGFKPSMSTAC